jgi:hypothetical protein
MAYPTVSAPYGYKPINLIGGQVFSGSTRMYPISYGYATSLFYGDPVTIQTTSSGNAVAGTVVTQASAVSTTNTIVGIFLGCYYTNPSTKQRLYSQYWPGGTLAADATAVVCDDPDTVFRAVACTAAGTATVASVSSLLVGQNVAGTTLTTSGSTATGDGASGVVAAGANASGGGFRVLGIVPESQITLATGTYVSGATTTTLRFSGLSIGLVVPVGTDVYQLLSGGGLQHIGSAVTTGVTVSSTTAQDITVTASTVTPSASQTLVLVQNPEVLVKINFSAHRYYVA